MPGSGAPDKASEEAARAARVAWRRGQAALREGDIGAALRWLDRACRLAPRDNLPRLGLATAWLRRDPVQAAGFFLVLTESHDIWEAWLGLAVARAQSGDGSGAVAALGVALGRFVAPEDGGWVSLADGIASAGWCALTDGDFLRLGPAGLATPEILVDGRVVPLHADGVLPRAARTGRWLTVRREGRDVVGSPIDLLARRGDVGVVARAPVPAEWPPIRPAKPPPARLPAVRPVDIVIPVYRDMAATMACLESVLAARPRGVRVPQMRVIVIDDAAPEPALVAALDRLAARRRILLVRHAHNRGFPAAANAGLRLARAAGHDALLLNADTLVAPRFLARLRAVAYAAADIGTACPLSNNATILSYPDPAGGNAMPDRVGTARLAELAWAANGAANGAANDAGAVEIPTAVGFCMYLRHDCLRAVGLLRADVFGRGYGEENDFCMRAVAAGWRHVAAPGVFVAHAGQASFGAQAAGLRARNAAILERLHPTYSARVAAHVAADPLLPARRRLDILRARALQPGTAKAVVLITHARGGGVARSVRERCVALRAEGVWPIVLAPVEGQENGVQVEGFANLRFTLPDDYALLLSLLRDAPTERIEFHHTMGHPGQILALPRALGVPYVVHVHDYHWVCPRLVLSGPAGRYCGEPDIAGCNACVRQRGSFLAEKISIGDLRARSAEVFRDAMAVIAPSEDVAGRLGRYFPDLRLVVQSPGGAMPAVIALPVTTARRRIVVIGAIGAEKGFHILLDLAREAAEADRNLEFVVVGHTIGDTALLRTGRVFITGPYLPEEAVALIRAQEADFCLLPSVVPETWCHALTEAWEAGLHVVAFDLGAQAERIRARGGGMVLSAGMSASAINGALLAARW